MRRSLALLFSELTYAINLIATFGALLMVLSSPSQATPTARSVEYREGQTTFQGLLAYDDAWSGAKPGILLIHEWWGHNDYIERRAKEYAALGYVTFALDMYGKGKVGESASAASDLSAPFYKDRALMRSRAALGLSQLVNAALPKGLKVDATRLAALGYCFGGTVALELARSGAELNGVVVFHGGLATPDASQGKNIRGSVLVLNGAEDPMVKRDERTQFMDEMRASGVDWQFVEFGGAVHAFTNPGVDAKNLPGAKYNAAADQRSFALSKFFLAEKLGG